MYLEKWWKQLIYPWKINHRVIYSELVIKFANMYFNCNIFSRYKCVYFYLLHCSGCFQDILEYYSILFVRLSCRAITSTTFYNSSAIYIHNCSILFYTQSNISLVQNYFLSNRKNIKEIIVLFRICLMLYYLIIEFAYIISLWSNF